MLPLPDVQLTKVSALQVSIGPQCAPPSPSVGLPVTVFLKGFSKYFLKGFSGCGLKGFSGCGTAPLLVALAPPFQGNGGPWLT